MRSPDNIGLRQIPIGDYCKRTNTETIDDADVIVTTWITRLPSGVFGRLCDVVENEDGTINAHIEADDFTGSFINGIWQ